ncbi:hypothetical protein L208DRAFT_1377769 [Tricholoma matsutake]|nr:hypothetical protein L208DRAFT_1377769 [Tricholoma matsutake 945]
MYQEELKLHWDSLPQTEKEDWDAQAATANAATNKSDEIYQNQALFPYELWDILCNLNRQGSNQIGNTVFHLHETFKTADDVDFKTFDAKYINHIMRPWTKYCQSYIKNNCDPIKIVDPGFELDNVGQPLLPEDFLKAQWSKASPNPTTPLETFNNTDAPALTTTSDNLVATTSIEDDSFTTSAVSKKTSKCKHGEWVENADKPRKKHKESTNMGSSSPCSTPAASSCDPIAAITVSWPGKPHKKSKYWTYEIVPA